MLVEQRQQVADMAAGAADEGSHPELQAQKRVNEQSQTA